MKTGSTIFLASLLALAGCGGSGSSSTAPPVEKPPPPQPAKIVIYAGNDQVAAAGSGLPAPLCTNVLDKNGRVMVGIMVTYTVSTGGGTMGQPQSVNTDAAGIATSGTWTLGPVPGKQSVTASAEGVPSITFTATAQ